MAPNAKDLGAGLVFVIAGALYLIYGLRTLPIGSSLQMGPGYFPVAVASMTVVMGLFVGIRSFFQGQLSPIGRIPWRAIVMLTLSVIAFALLLRRLGILPTVAITSMLAIISDKTASLRSAVAISLSIAALCTLVFKMALGLPLPIVAPWIAF